MGELRVPLETQTEAWYLQCNKEIQDFFFFNQATRLYKILYPPDSSPRTTANREIK